MLGLGKSRSTWNWVAHGKHPCARDYVTIGRDDALSQAFSGWMDKGYEAMGAAIKKDNMARSWRFWAKPPKGDLLVVGIVRDSCDAIGRPYPLMMIGTGSIPEWQNRWHLLPYACNGTWTQMEQLAARRYEDTSRFRDELGNIGPPQPDWKSYDQEINQVIEKATRDSAMDRIKKTVASLVDLAEFIVPMDTPGFDSVFSLLSLWHTVIKAKYSRSPSAVFMGGTSTHTYLAAYGRALSVGDFATLWSVQNKEE